jgi:hypothetical protein
MREVVHHVVLALSVLGLAQAALRVATLLVPSGLERVIAAAVLGVAVAVAEALTLGLVGLGGSPIGLAAAAAATWAAAFTLLPKPAISPWTELIAWWGRVGGAGRIGAAALSGASLAWLAWQLRHPSIGFDSALYHYPEVAGWIANGRPGSILTLSYDIPYGNYPLTDEVALTWGAGIARSWIPLALWNPALLVALAGACWLTLRNFSVSRAAAGLGTAALVTTPLLVRQLNEPQNDLPTLAWLACTAALVSGVRRRPALLVPAVVGAGLAVGTKATAAPMALAALGVGIYLARGALRPLAGWLALALAGAFAVGGVWYARNVVQHGAPLWPFSEMPWGDARPRFFALIDTSFIERPGATIDGRLGQYVSRLGGAWILLAAPLLVLAYGALARRRPPGLRCALVLSGTLVLVGFLAWSMAWGTGLPATAALPGAAGWSLAGLRYMLPVIGAGVVAVALATRVPGLVGGAAHVVLAVALSWNVIADARLGFPYTPSARTLVEGVLAGVIGLGVVVVAGRGPLRRAWRAQLVPAGALAVLVAVAVGALAAPVSNGFVERYSRVHDSTAPGAEVVAWFLSQRGFEEGHGTIAFASRAVLAPLAGDHFTHRLTLVPPRARCQAVARLASRIPVVVTDPNFFGGLLLGVNPYSAPRCLAGRRPAYGNRNSVYRVYRLTRQAPEPRAQAAEQNAITSSP